MEHVLEHTVAAAPVMVSLLERFTAVEIGDRTMITLPAEYREEFPDCGDKSGRGQAAVKIQTRWELRTGKLTKLVVEPGRVSDGQNEAAEESVVPGSLSIRDLGYSRWRRLPQRDAAGAY